MDIFTPVQSMLVDLPIDALEVVSLGSGVPVGTLKKIKYKDTTDPRVRSVERLYTYLFEPQPEWIAKRLNESRKPA